ncbi:hypothetical protein [Microbulbifer sp. DLAB2-AA]|uniref:hypothetical protein n=1 Tax=Microbulbifer sp. DLAB2-AA TaxID=3243394 RepID=UPI00403A3D1C
MLQVLVSAGVVFILLKFLERGKNRGLDGFASIAFVLVPALLILLANIGAGIVGVDKRFLVLLALLYFIVPLFMLRLQFDLSWGRSFLYGLFVFLVVIVVDSLFYLMIGFIRR